MNRLTLTQLAAGVLLVYTALHIHEEAYFGLHLWMGENWGIEGISFGRWLFHNAAFFVPALTLGLFIHLLDPERFQVIAVAMLWWGLLNCLEHTIFTVINLRPAPGFFSGLLFAALAILGIRRLNATGDLHPRILLRAFALQLAAFWALPMAGFILLRDHVGRIVGG